MVSVHGKFCLALNNAMEPFTLNSAGSCQFPTSAEIASQTTPLPVGARVGS